MRESWVFVGIALLATLPPAVAQAQRADSPGQYDCVIQPRQIVDLGTSEEGVIAHIGVERGDIVEKDQVVAELEAELEELQVALTHLRATSQSQVNSNRAQLAFRKKQKTRMAKLHQRRVISTRQRDEADVESDIAGYNLETAQMNLDISKVEFKQAEERLRRRTIHSPVKGIVTEVTMSAGELVHEQTSIMQIAELHPLHVEVFVPVSEYRRVLRDRTATVFPQQPIGGRYTATIEVIDQVFDAASETFGIRLLLDNEDYSLPAGLRCTVSFGSST